jgi:hypothetical protein
MVSWKSTAAVIVSAGCLAAGPLADPLSAQDRGRGGDRGNGLARGRALTRPQQPQRPLRSQQEPAYARGYDDGYQDGLADGRKGLRYDPVESRQYRDGDGGYVAAYGSRDAYRNNYRAGFRQGYETGYREATR